MSVVIASLVGSPFIDDCLRSLEQQSRSRGVETVVVACGTAEYARRIEREYPWVRVLHCPKRESVPVLRRRGVEAARGSIIAIIEEHCVAAPDWLERALEAHASGGYGAVGGPVAPQDYKRLRDWVVYFCEYNGYLPPWQAGETTHLGSANIAYSREVLLRYQDELEHGYWEAGLHPRLLSDGVKLLSVPKMVVYHRGPFDYAYYLGQRYWFSRAFAAARNLTLARRLVYVLASPVVPLLLLVRMMSRVLQQRCHVSKFIAALPLFIPVLMVYVAGECAGYVAGVGEALLRVE
jgi:glycosyltransferase involved in cell wall biosynthesis